MVRVFQTAKDPIWNNYKLHGVTVAVGSRKNRDWEVGLRWREKKGR
jgi:hypothetical protein